MAKRIVTAQKKSAKTAESKSPRADMQKRTRRALLLRRLEYILRTADESVQMDNYGMFDMLISNCYRIVRSEFAVARRIKAAPTIDAGLVLDTRILKMVGLGKNAITDGYLSWWPKKGRPTPVMYFDFSSVYGGISLKLKFRTAGIAKGDSFISIDGERRKFLCPACNKLASQLILKPGAVEFACLACSNLKKAPTEYLTKFKTLDEREKPLTRYSREFGGAA